VWNTPADRFESFALFADVFDRAGHTSKADAVRAEMQRMQASGELESSDDEHDHEHDHDHEGEGD
jgi:hypothetical protein